MMRNIVNENVKKHKRKRVQRVPGCFDMKTTVFYVANIVMMLKYIHGLGIVHRDLKPENLLLGNNGYLKLADFGFAKDISVTNDRSYSLCGTPEYTAPEIYKRTGHSYGADWWALGVILYEFASGFSPFHVGTANGWDSYLEISRYIGAYPNVHFPSIFTDNLQDILLSLLCPTLSDRYGSPYLPANVCMKHNFFDEIDWKQLEKQAITAPFIPEIKDVMDDNHFDDCDDIHTISTEYNMPRDRLGSWADAF